MANRDCVRTNWNKETDGPMRSETKALMRDGRRHESLRDRLAGILKHENPVGMTVLVISTLNVLFALFGNDFQLAFFDKSADRGFQIGFIVSFVLFLAEMIVTALIEENYKWSFFFWLDVVATASLCLDVPWIVDPISAFLFGEKSAPDTGVRGSAARAGRAGRIGGKSTNRTGKSGSEKGWLTAEGWEKLLWVYKESYGGKYLSGEPFERHLLSLEVPDLEGGGRVRALDKITSADGSFLFSSFTHILVIEPIEKMVQIIKQLARDPLKRPQVTDSEDATTSKNNRNESKLETSMLENTILKIGGLMQLGFGQAGAEIIAQNMSSEGGSLDLLIPGRKVHGVFGFADIVNFEDITECLSEEVMVFVNKIARIVHHCVNEWGGTTNKNIGDSFFVVWLVEDEEERDAADSMSLARTSVLGFGKSSQTDTALKKVKELCNKSLFAFLKILAEFCRASDLAAYAKHPKIIPRFGAGYSVHLNLGLHCGWAIQGVVGSKFKIDASYFSPHVNMAARLLSATRHFGVNILFSDTFHANLCTQAQSRCRQVDSVVLKGTHSPVKIFTFDNIRNAFEGSQVDPPKLGNFHPPDDVLEASENIDWMFMVDQDIAMMQRGITVEFQAMWRQALENYLRGEWNKAEEFARKCLMMMPDDGPSSHLLSFLKSFDGVPPADWQGYRHLKMK
ncbi:adenylate and guanylate cyclase catalytic domain-containing protein [Besnoitia besnoiti]|uniref:Adenylate and guanylate cyclase catalytic domain-containing protein n=1 Tax=Besnoitia besnoiti TaxID=94643 RepID=A0A2A9MR08_BESBE|nr:adenylate and guanylate cyclase catalytic domain-containing protein [Besnoitia besnoiti]PFH38720.1 adenylate and guanylate cyclase catalytic domain-containing protein [Besnoitia besnoiti]